MVGRRVAQASSERNSALLILGLGSAAATASLFGSIWVVRAGVIVAVIMAAVALTVAFSQIKKIRAEHAVQLRREVELRMAAADRHHADSVAMIERFNARAENLTTVISQLRARLAASLAELSTMRGNAAYLRAEVAERQAHIETLKARIAELEAEEESTIIELPEAAYPSAEDIWATGEHPTMVDLRQIRLDDVEEPLRKHA